MAAGVVAGPAVWAYGPGGGSATLSVTVNQGSNGVDSLSVTGSGFGPSETVQFTASSPSESLGTATSTPSGDVSATLVLPAGYSAGTHTLVGTGSVSGNTGSASFTLTAASGAINPCPRTAASASGSQIVLVSFSAGPCLGNTPGNLPGQARPGAAAPGGAGLPLTGAQSETIAAVAATAVCAGGLLVLASRRRRSSTWR